MNTPNALPEIFDKPIVTEGEDGTIVQGNSLIVPDREEDTLKD